MSRFESLCELFPSSAGLIWLTIALPSSPAMMLGGASRFLELAPVWSVVHVPFVLLTAANVVNARNHREVPRRHGILQPAALPATR